MLLELYEILPCEPLHDVKGHIQNLFEEIPYHTKKEKLLQKTIDHVMGGKNCNRRVDYRVGLIQLVVLLRDKIDNDIFNIFETMCEIQEVVYSGESKRSVEMILRLQNQSFLHRMLLKKIVKDKPLSPKLTKKKFYGKYLHALIAHAAMLLRMVSGKSINTEEEERTFNSLKTITTSTSNFHPDHVILNGITRYQAKGDFNAPYLIPSETVVSKFSKSLPKKICPTIPYWIINKFPWDWQAHLERISDFVLEENIWWEETPVGIVFNDRKKPHFTNLNPHHYWTWNLLNESRYLKSCWEKCLENIIIIPTMVMWTDNGRLIPNNLKYATKFE